MLPDPVLTESWLHGIMWPALRADPFVCCWARHSRRKGHSSAICSTQSHSCPLPPLISTGWRCNCWASQDTRRSIQVLPAPTLSSVTQAHLYKLEGQKTRWMTAKTNEGIMSCSECMIIGNTSVCHFAELSAIMKKGKKEKKTKPNWLIRNRLRG